MPREPRAVLFDLDDTLYPQRRFVLSGLATVARHLAARYDIAPAALFRTLCAAFRHGGRGAEIQQCLRRHDLAESLVDELVELVRQHRPNLRLPDATREVLETLRGDWRIAIVTNGPPTIQKGKVGALGLEPLVDSVVYAAQHGSGRGKPDAEPFEAALRRLGVDAGRAIFVGDNEDCDIRGAAAVGMPTIRIIQRHAVDEPDTRADTIVRSIREVPIAVAHLVGFEWSRDVA